MAEARFKERVDGACGKLDALLAKGGTKKEVVFLVIATVSLIWSFVVGGSLPVDPAWIAILLCGLPIVCGAVIGLVTEFDIKADVLVSIALIASIVVGEYFAAGEVAAGIGNATRHGCLVKEGDALERLAQADVAAFDKTGTLTYG